MDNFQSGARSQNRQRQNIDGFIQNRNQLNGSSRIRIDVSRQSVQRQRVRPATTLITQTVSQPSSRRLPALDMSLPGAGALIKQQPVVRHRRFYRLRTWMFRSVVTTLIVVIGLGGILFTQGYLKLHKVFRGGATAAALQQNVNPNTLKGEGDGRVNILLMGIGGAGHEAPDLTDTVMIASIDPVNKTASLLSVPRDMWVNIPNNGKMKLNAAYETGKYKYLHKIDNSNADANAVKAGFTMADQTIEDVTGINIHYNMLLDFTAFRKSIDTVGGVTVNVPDQLYDPNLAWENGWNPVIAKAGSQSFDGKHALMYVRSRETTSDFARSQRQRSVLLALKEKVVTLGTLSNPLKISELMNNFGDNVHTDLSLSDSVSLYNIFKNISNNQIGSVGLADEPNNFLATDTVNGQSVVRPKLGFFDYTDIRKFVRGSLADGFIKKENANITILNGTGTPGIATNRADKLKSYGYNVGTVTNAPTQNYEKTIIVDLTKGKDKYTQRYLEQRFGVKATTNMPDSAILPGKADFVIILGNNETFSSQD